ncbi:MAG: hypothetical protein LBT00_04260 [Spirochaetaceae bacterium]|jgi:hypothetical protein|nr:hypothetical protein [Spirochaetaceae bacterium]
MEHYEITKEGYEKGTKIAKDCLGWVENKIKENIRGRSGNPGLCSKRDPQN